MIRAAVASSALVAAFAASSSSTGLFVDCQNGSDENSGSSPSSAFLTLNRARDAIRALPRPLANGIVVFVNGVCAPRNSDGSYNFSAPVLELDNTAGLDSGSPSAPIVWQAGSSGALLTGGLQLPTSGWQPYAQAPGCFSLDLTTVAGYDASFGLGSLQAGGLGTCANYKAELYVGQSATVRARYPNLSPTGAWEWLYSTGVTNNTLDINTTRPIDKAWPSTAWLHGMWSFDWADSYVQLASALPCANGPDSCTRLSVNSSTPPLYGLIKGCRVMAVDLLQELDAPNESYLDGASHTAYYCPLGGSMAALTQPLYVSMATNVVRIAGYDAGLAHAAAHPKGIETLHDADEIRNAHPGSRLASYATGPSNTMVQYVTLRGFAVSHARGTGIMATAVNAVTLDSLTVQGHGQAGVVLSDAWNSLATNLTITQTGCDGISVTGGNVGTLQPANTVVQYSTISEAARVTRTYTPPVSWFGVGLTVKNCEIFNSPHSGILGSGNNCQFTGNYLHDLAYEVTDSGAWYSGRSWTHRGNFIFNNTFERIVQTEKPALGAPAVNAVYFDDQLSQQLCFANTFKDVYNGVLLGGGRDNLVNFNRFTNCTGGTCMTFDNRGMNWQTASCTYNASDPSNSGQLVTQLFAVDYQQPPYSTAYPWLPGLLQNHPCVPVNNLIANNSYCGAARGFVDRSVSTIEGWFSTYFNNTEAC